MLTGGAYDSVALAIWYILMVIVVWLYYALMEISSKQGTLRKMALGIKVTDLNGNKINFGRATGRYFGKIISAFILFVGFIMIAFTQKKQGLHDIMSRCLVVNREFETAANSEVTNDQSPKYDIAEIQRRSDKYEEFKDTIINEVRKTIKTKEEITILESQSRIPYTELIKLGRPGQLTDTGLFVYKLLIEEIDKTLQHGK